jgi:glycosyltransferase involved in cell wall biosynthesis
LTAMTDPRPRFSICSPAHNEELNLPLLVEEVRRAMVPAFGLDWEQILVDDGSTDRSAEIVAELAASHHALRLLRHEKNLGERAAWTTALAQARGEIVVMLAADRQNDPRDIPRLIRVILDEGFDCGTGSRSDRKDDLFFWCATRILNTFMRGVFGLSVSDASSSFFAARRALVRDLGMVENDHRYILALFHRRGATIREIPTAHRPREAGRAHYSRAKVLRAMPELLRFVRRYYSGYYDVRERRAEDQP